MTATVKKPRAKKAAPVPANDGSDFVHDAVVIRTVDSKGRAYGGFQWPMTKGAYIECPDWKPIASCGHGFHGLLDGIGNWGLTSDDNDAVWQIVGVKRDECVSIDGEKVKFPRCRVIDFGPRGKIIGQIIRPLNAFVVATAQKAGKSKTAVATTGDGAPAATTGYGAPAATTGYGAPAATTGARAPAATTGARAPAATTGKNSVAAALGINSTATAGEGGAIVLAAYDGNYNLVAVFASMVGENGIEAGKVYRLGVDGKPVEAA